MFAVDFTLATDDAARLMPPRLMMLLTPCHADLPYAAAAALIRYCYEESKKR